MTNKNSNTEEVKMEEKEQTVRERIKELKNVINKHLKHFPYLKYEREKTPEEDYWIAKIMLRELEKKEEFIKNIKRDFKVKWHDKGIGLGEFFDIMDKSTREIK